MGSSQRLVSLRLRLSLLPLRCSYSSHLRDQFFFPEELKVIESIESVELIVEAGLVPAHLSALSPYRAPTRGAPTLTYYLTPIHPVRDKKRFVLLPTFLSSLTEEPYNLVLSFCCFFFSFFLSLFNFAFICLFICKIFAITEIPYFFQKSFPC